MARNPTNRVSPEKKAVAERLRQVWLRKKGDLGLTQTQIAEKLDMSQSAFSQYLHGYVPTNTDLIVRIASIMDVDPRDIDPSVVVSSAPRLTLASRTLALRGGLMGDLKRTEQTMEVAVNRELPTDQLSIVVMDTDHYAPRYFIGEHLIIQLVKPININEGDELLVQWPDGINELLRAGQRVADQHEMMDLLNPSRQLGSLQVLRFEGNVFKVVGRA